MISKFFKNVVISFICLFITLGLTVFILNWDKHTLEIMNLGVFFIKILPFVFAMAAICFFPFDRVNVPLKLLFVLFSFGVIFSYGFCKLIFLFLKQVEYQEFYLLLQMITPIIILSLALALRCGGMLAKDVAVFGAIAFIYMVSGIEDLMAQVVRMSSPGYVFPETWDWATHMTIFVGRPLNKYEAFVFIGIHFVIIALILYIAYAKNNIFMRLSKKLYNKILATNDISKQ